MQSVICSGDSNTRPTREPYVRVTRRGSERTRNGNEHPDRLQVAQVAGNQVVDLSDQVLTLLLVLRRLLGLGWLLRSIFSRGLAFALSCRRCGGSVGAGGCRVGRSVGRGLTACRTLAISIRPGLRRSVRSGRSGVLVALARVDGSVVSLSLHADPQGVLEDELRDDSLYAHGNASLELS